MARLIVALMTFLVITDWTLGQSPGTAKVQVLSLEIRKPAPAGVDKELSWASNLGTRVQLLVSMPDKYIVGVESKVDSCTDDTAADLMTAKEAANDSTDSWKRFLRFGAH